MISSRQQSTTSTVGNGFYKAGQLRRRLLPTPSLGLFGSSSYKVHAIVGDESCLASLADESAMNLLKNTAIPATAFVIGCLVTAIAAGTLTGPSVALAPLVSGVVVNGVVVDSAAVAAGMALATRTRAITEMLIKDRPDGELAAKTKGMPPPKKGKGRYLVVTGGMSDGAVIINEIGSKEKFEKRYSVKMLKVPLKNLGGVAAGGGSSTRNKIWKVGKTTNENRQETHEGDAHT